MFIFQQRNPALKDQLNTLAPEAAVKLPSNSPAAKVGQLTGSQVAAEVGHVTGKVGHEAGVKVGHEIRRKRSRKIRHREGSQKVRRNLRKRRKKKIGAGVGVEIGKKLINTGSAFFPIYSKT